MLGPIHKQRWIYSCVKQLLDRIIWAYGQQGLQFTLFRPFNWIGSGLDSMDDPKEGSSRVLTQFLGHIVRGEPIKLVDGGSQTRAFTYIDDAVDCLTTHHRQPGRHRRRQDLQHRQSAQSVLDPRAGRDDAGDRRCRGPSTRRRRATPKLIDISALDYYGKGYADIPARLPSIKNTTAELGWTPSTDMRAALDGDLRFLRPRAAFGLGAAVARCLKARTSA